MWRRILPLVMLALPVVAPRPVAGQEMEEMAAMMEAGTPGEMHELLGKTVGTWNVTVKVYMDPSAPPMEMTGTATVEMIMDGRFVAEHVEGAMMDMPFRGLGITGYNNTAERFESTWLDNMATTLYTYTGMLDGEKIVLTGSYQDPMSGESVTQRSVLTFIDDDHYMVQNYETRGGQEALGMEIHYIRTGM